MMGRTWIKLACLGAALGLMPRPSIAGPLDPLQFQSLGSLSLTTPGTYLISGTSLIVGSTTYTGVVSNGVAVFDFSSINIASGVTLTAAPGGSMAIALLSQSNAVIDGKVDVSAVGTQAGVGASNTGVGGNGMIVGRTSDHPFGYTTGSGGGGFGGAGGAGGLNGAAGGAATSTPLFFTLQGGSAGGSPFGGGGGGGGGIEIGASQRLAIGGEVDATGGLAPSGGGGSGGGIFLHATEVRVGGLLNAQGGMGSIGNLGQAPGGGGGGGGGGQIDIFYSTPDLYTAGTYNVGGGAGGAFFNNGQAGANGFVLAIPGFTPPVVPEPSSLILLGTSTLGLLGVAGFRRLRGGRGETSAP